MDVANVMDIVNIVATCYYSECSDNDNIVDTVDIANTVNIINIAHIVDIADIANVANIVDIPTIVDIGVSHMLWMLINRQYCCYCTYRGCCRYCFCRLCRFHGCYKLCGYCKYYLHCKYLHILHIANIMDIINRRLGGESKPGNLNGSCEPDAEAGVLEFD